MDPPNRDARPLRLQEPPATFWNRLEKKDRGLFVWNTVAAGTHFVSFIVLVSLQRDWKVPIHRTVARWTSVDSGYGCFETLPNGTQNVCVVETVQLHVGEVSLLWETAAFFLLSAVFQGAVSMLWLSRAHGWIMQGISPLRWFEYSVSASVMILIIAQLSGMYSLQMQLVLFFAMAGVMGFGLLHEYITLELTHARRTDSAPVSSRGQFRTAHDGIFAPGAVPLTLSQRPPRYNNAEADSPMGVKRGMASNASWTAVEVPAAAAPRPAAAIKWAAHIFGWIPYIGVWVAIFISFFSTLAESSVRPPWQVYTIIIGLFFGFSGFAFVQIMYTYKFHRDASNPTKDQLNKVRAERMYIFLSLFTKTFLAWNLYGGVLMRSENSLTHSAPG